MSKTKLCVIIILVNLVLLGGGALFIAWYSDHMVFPTFSVVQGAINAYNFTSNNHLNATFIFIVHSQNHDPKYHIKYTQLVVSVYHANGYSLSYETEPRYTEVQGKGTFFTAHPVARDVAITDKSVADKIRNETTVSGHLDLEVRVRSKVSFKVKKWKHKQYILRAICSPVVVNFTTWKTYNKTDCNVDTLHE